MMTDTLYTIGARWVMFIDWADHSIVHENRAICSPPHLHAVSIVSSA
jgi:hypothetical protein